MLGRLAHVGWVVNFKSGGGVGLWGIAPLPPRFSPILGGMIHILQGIAKFWAKKSGYLSRFSNLSPNYPPVTCRFSDAILK